MFVSVRGAFPRKKGLVSAESSLQGVFVSLIQILDVNGR